ncbi:MAG: hypothetical protein H6624_01955 [Bdellovibrionaceae bacterium]|nr:hypothetical protein [Bdellovibrionales bacterium]MCB9083073.1 hypothetical protein [Pseudobdellovibrionaceae bacterium]
MKRNSLNRSKITLRGLRHLLALGITTLSLACQTQAPPLVAPPEPPPPPEVYVENQAVAEPTNNSFEPKLDILFVIDDSQSMAPHQQRLAANINRFVESFSVEGFIDFHIGVIPIWDSVRYGSMVKELSSSGQRNYDPIGELKPLKAPEGQENLVQGIVPRYLSRDTFEDRNDFLNVLKETLLIGYRPYCCTKTQIREIEAAAKKAGTEPKIEYSGPEYEELFSPVVAALGAPERLQGPNQGFFRPGSQLVLVFMTDADDASPTISVDWFHDYLLGLTRDRSGEKLSTYGILHPTSYPTSKACPKDPAKTAAKLEDFLAKTKGRVFNICSQNYGDELAKMGQEIRKKTLERFTIYLDRIPEEGTLLVKYGNVLLKEGENPGWTKNSAQKKIIVHGLDLLPHQPGAKIDVQFTNVDPTRPDRSARIGG